MREIVTSTVEVAGAVAITIGVGLLAVSAGLIVGGLLAIGFAWRASQ